MKALVFLLCMVACSTVSMAQSFTQVYPSQPIAHAAALAHWNGDTVFACGPNSLFMRSTDAGLTWRDVFSRDTHYDFPQMGASARGIFLLPAASSLTQGEFTDSTSTFLLHYNPVTGDTHRVYVPVSFAKKFPDYLPRILSVTVDAVFMLQYSDNSSTAGMTLLRSMDEGATWEQLPLPAAISRSTVSMKFGNANFGTFLGYLTDSSSKKSVFITANAGATWERVYGFQPASFTRSSVLQCVDDSTIVVLGTDYLLHVTRDRGAHWSVSAPPPFSIGAFHFLSDGTGYVSGGDAQVASSTDFGVTWTHIKTGAWYGESTGISCLTLQPDVFVYFDFTGMAFMTRDGGLTWDFAFPDFFRSMSSLQFFSRNDGFMLSNPSRTRPWREFYGTTDGGASWNLLFNDDVITYSSTVVPISANEFWAIRFNADTMMYHSSNKGAAWEASYIRTPGDTITADWYTRGAFAHGTDSLCVLLKSGILRTTDRGKSWSVHPQVMPFLSNMQGNDMKYLFACFKKHIWLGTIDKILRSDDFGMTWKVVATLDTAVYESWDNFKPVSDSTVYITLDIYINNRLKTSLMRTSDAGNTWETYVQGGPYQMYDLFATLFADGTGYASHGLGYWNEYYSENQLSKTTDAWKTSSVVFSRHYWQSGFTTIFVDKDYGWAYLDALYRTTTGGVDWVKLPPPHAPSTFTLEHIFPNPTTASTGSTIEFTVGGNQFMPVNVELYDILGKRVSSVYHGGFAPGRHAVRIPTSTLAPGVHIVRLTARDAVLAKTMVVR